MNISMDKKYTLNNRPFTVLTITKPGPLPVVGYDDLGDVDSFTAQGHYGPSSLVEVSPYADFLIDEKVMVRGDDSVRWERRLFSGIDKINGLPEASNYPKWIRGSGNSVAWNQCRRPTAEEISE